MKIDTEIKKGDLVICTKWACSHGTTLAAIYEVKYMEYPPRSVHCSCCGIQMPIGQWAFDNDGFFATRIGAPVEWLKKIEPLGEDTSQPEEESLIA